MRNLYRSETGASAVEFALLLPLLLMILFGIIEFGLALHAQTILTNASREGARAGIVLCTSNCPNVTATVTNYVTNAGLIGTPTISTTCAALPYVCVKVELPYTFIVLPGLTTMVPTINLVGQTVMRHE